MVDAAIISGLLSNLAPLIKDEFSLFWSFRKEVQKLSSTLSSINAVLEDAERKNVREKDKQTEDWLGKLKDVVYEVRDIMDECSFKDLKLQVKRLNASSSTRIQVTNSITRPFSSTLTRLKIGHKIKDVQEKLDQISSERKKLHLRESNHYSKTETLNASWRETMSLSECSLVYGRDNEKKQIVDILVNRSSEAAEKLSVLPIVGIGGLGKTTLVQMVFNDHEVDKHFDPKIWVCVSNEFDIKLVIKAIIATTNETSLEELQKKVRNLLNGKRYLIVLDDVWNENIEKWDKLRSILDCGSNGAFVLTTTRKRSVAEIMETIPHFNLSSLPEDDCWLLFKERAFKHGEPKSLNFFEIGKDIARKCKGIPLVAKTLGSQLRFKDDENEWCRIRDNEIWEISENEKSILPILKLSYYDLPNDLRRCFAYCAIFPKNTEIEKEGLIQMWMAHGLISTSENKEMEEVGNKIWNELCWRSFFQDEIEKFWMTPDWYILSTTCKMHDFYHDLAQSIMKDECYMMYAKSSSDGFGREIRHVAVIYENIEEISFGSLEKIGRLQSMILHTTNYLNFFSKETLSVFKKLPSLRVLQVCTDEEILDLGCLKHLRYLNLSNSRVKTLPDSISHLLNLQTLNLNHCEFLESLPKNTKDLINLRHLYLEGCDELKYMPRGMEQLKHLKTLSLFVIDKKNRDGQLDELKELNIGGSLRIRNLERVSDASIARGISMAKKSSISKLELEWKNNDEGDDNQTNRHEKIAEALEVSTKRLKILKMCGYKGVNIPKWVRQSSASLTHLQLGEMENVKHLFTTLFPLLEELEISKMKNLTELVSPPISISAAGAFTRLCKIQIKYCSNIGALPFHFKSLKDVTVFGDCSDELLYSILNLSSLTHLSLRNMDERSVLFGASSTSSNGMNGMLVLFPLLEELTIWGLKNLRELVSPITVTEAFPNLWKMNIIHCPKLGTLPHHLKSLKNVTIRGEYSDDLLYSISNISVLTFLSIGHMHQRSVLFPPLIFDDEVQGGGLALQSLQHLFIGDCYKLSCLFDEGYREKERTRGFTNLNSLHIAHCPELMVSLEQLKNLPQSLQSLSIMDCPKLLSSKVEGSKVEEADDAIALLRSFRARLAVLYSLQARLGRENLYVDILKE